MAKRECAPCYGEIPNYSQRPYIQVILLSMGTKFWYYIFRKYFMVEERIYTEYIQMHKMYYMVSTEIGIVFIWWWILHLNIHQVEQKACRRCKTTIVARLRNQEKDFYLEIFHRAKQKIPFYNTVDWEPQKALCAAFPICSFSIAWPSPFFV